MKTYPPAPATNDNRPAFLPAVCGLTLWAAAAFAVILGFSRLSYGLLLPSLRADLPGTYSTYGLIGTINFLGYFIGTLSLPDLVRRWPNRPRFNIVAMLALNLTMLGAALSFDLLQLAIWRGLVGFISALATVLTMSLTLERIEPRQRGLASGLIWMGGTLGIVVSGLLAPLIISSGVGGGWRWAWIAMAGAGLVASYGFWQTYRSLPALANATSANAAPPVGSLKILFSLFRPGYLLWLTLSYFLFGCGYIIYFTFFISLVTEQGVPALLGGLVWAGIGLAGSVGGWVWGRAIDRQPTGYTMAISLGLGVLGVLGVLTHNLGLEFVGAILVGSCGSIGPPLMVTALLKRAVPDRDYTASFSFVTAIFAGGQLLGPLIGGRVIESFDLTLGVATSAIFLAGSAGLSVLYGRPKPPPV